MDTSQYDNYSDEELASMANAPISNAILGQESGKNPNSATSVDGAVGQGQITPDTWVQYAKPGEKIDNADDNLTVHHRIINDLSQKFNGDPQRIAVGYFSGPGNVAPADSPTPYIKDTKDGNGKTVSSYVADVNGRLPKANTQVADAGNIQTDAQTDGLDLSKYSQYSDDELAKMAGTTDEKTSQSTNAVPQGSVVNPSAINQWGNNTLELAKNAATATGAAMSEPMNNPNVSDWSQHPVMGPLDAAVRGVGKIGNDLGGTFGVATAPDSAAFGTGVERSGIVPATASFIKNNLVPDDPRFTANISPEAQHQIAMNAGSDLNNAFLMALGAKKPMGSAASDELMAKVPSPVPNDQQQPPDNGLMSFLKDQSSGGKGVPDSFPLPKLVVDNTSGGPGIPDNIPLSSAVPDFMKPREPLPSSLFKMDDSPNAQPLLVAKETYPKAQGVIVKALDAEPNIDASKIADRMEEAKASGQPITALDAATQEIGDGRQLRGLADYVANAPGKGSIMASKFAVRGAQAGQRIGNMLDDAISKTPFYKTQNDAIQQMEGSGPLYKEAFASNQNMNSPIINRVLNTPAGKQALNSAARTMQQGGQLLGVSSPDLVEQNALSGGVPTGVGISDGLKMSTLHTVKGELYDLAQKEYDPMTKKYTQYGKNILSSYHDLLKEMNDNDSTRVPNQPNSGLYAKANQTYATPARIRNALNEGREFNNMDPEEITEYLNDKNRSTPEKAAFATGARRSLQDKVDTGMRSGDTNPVNSVWKVPTQKKIAAIIPDADAYKNLSDFMNREINMASNDKILQGSQTAGRQEYGKEIKAGTTKIGDMARMTDPSNLVGHVLDKAFAKHAEDMTQDTAAVAMRYLTSTDPAVWRDLASRTGQKQPLKKVK